MDISKSNLNFSMEKDTVLNIVLKTKEIDKIYYNNQEVNIDKSNVYTEILRTFKNCDKIEILTKAEVRLVSLKGSTESVTIKYGNILLDQLGNKRYIGNINNENINKKLKRCNSKK